MTEAEWLSATDPQPMLEFLRGKASDRKLRLFAVFCKREYLRFRPDLHRSITVRYADATERYADEASTFDEWDGIRRNVHGAFHDTDAHQQAMFGIDTATCCCCDDQAGSRVRDEQLAAEYVRLISAVQCVFGNPFRPVAFDPAWRSETAVAFATGIYADRAFDRLPILADVLEEAGCDHPDILAHCRGPGAHARGCWVVDLVLNRS